MKTVDLRSDTVTQPTAAMRAAMMAAPLGDDVFGDDPTVNALQDRIAAITGKEAALFMPSGTQSNLCGILAHCGRGDEYIVGQLAHTYRHEGGGAAVFGSVQPQPLTQDAQGRMALADIAAAIKPDDPHFARTRLLCLENTWNGHEMPDDYLRGATQLARENGLTTHLDGARVFNAAVASAAPGQAAFERLREIVDPFDSLSVCFSKGLGAPVGSALCGSRELIDRARRVRKMAGGGLRQAGLLAACALHALDHHVDRLGEDHANARRLADGLGGIEGLAVRSAETNIVFVDVSEGRGPALLDFLKAYGVLATGLMGLRLVTHLDVDAAGIDRTIAAVRRFFAEAPAALTASGRLGPY
ncbi:MAG: low-specificity L-threonine aldolase [Hydrogenophaga sp.]|uniref:low-specificity L-threonine aldolase n=1 Tax=Hydrogenophaga sp. TaxID=1904254 RepID=UPI00271F1A97|nr:low-specificity L-threonine aldolase [Hydrogenophaga sp.]MDO9147335.1 low-specificity L-threonine aldolase [Hydrogenophaga sp.]MDO9606594.1 low-specificity L-threonine aldolase [Hydrogenophaga sp.]MDP2163432.1 low-specificity L-threonine aldolase [Hydrogenophaga sp.]MDP3476735.1 low-specificity L-threonine aldolase [Hydrogenophaga sp.]